MTEQVVTTLVSKVKFEADNRPLLAFEKRLDSVFSKLDGLTRLAQKRITLKVGLDTKSLNAQLKVASNAKIVLNNIDVSKEAVTTTMVKLSDKLSGAKLRIENVSISMKSIAAQKRLMRDLLDSTQIDLPVELRLRAAERQLSAFKKKVSEKHTLYLTADISKHKLYQNIKKSLDYVTSKTQAMRLEPLIQLKVDRNGLKQEIEDVLHQIERAAKIRIQLNGDISGGQQASGGTDRGFARGAMTGGVAGAAMHWGRGFVPGLGGAFAISEMNKINQEYKGSEIALEAVSGKEDYQGNAAFLKALSKEQGRNFRDIAPQFTSILASSKEAIGSKGTQDMFRGIMKYGTMMNLDQEAMKGSFRAIGQMFSKDKIQAEEAQGQFAERMPAGMQLLAKAYGTTVPELREDMQKGKLDPKKLIPELGKIMENLADSSGGYAKALESTRIAQGRFNASFEEAVVLFADSGMDRALGNFFRGSSEQIDRSSNLIKALGQAFEWMMVPINAAIRLIGDFSTHVLPKLAEWFGMSEGAVVGFGAAALISLTPLGRMVTIIGALITGLDDFATYLKGGESAFGTWMESLSEDKQAKLQKLGKGIMDLAGHIGDLFALSAEGWSNIFGWLEEGGAGWTVIDGVNQLVDGLNALIEAIKKLSNGDTSGLDAMASSEGTLVSRNSLWNVARGNVGIGEAMDAWTGKYNASQGGLVMDRPSFAAQRQNDALAMALSKQPTKTDMPPMVLNFKVEGVQGAEDLESRLPGMMRDAIQKSWQSVLPQVTQQKK